MAKWINRFKMRLNTYTSCNYSQQCLSYHDIAYDTNKEPYL